MIHIFNKTILEVIKKHNSDSLISCTQISMPGLDIKDCYYLVVDKRSLVSIYTTRFFPKVKELKVSDYGYAKLATESTGAVSLDVLDIVKYNLSPLELETYNQIKATPINLREEL